MLRYDFLIVKVTMHQQGNQSVTFCFRGIDYEGLRGTTFIVQLFGIVQRGLKEVINSLLRT